MLRFILISILTLLTSLVSFAQQPQKTSNNQAVKSSPAYAEILLRKTELESDVESLLISYTEDFPKIKENKFVP